MLVLRHVTASTSHKSPRRRLPRRTQPNHHNHHNHHNQNRNYQSSYHPQPSTTTVRQMDQVRELSEVPQRFVKEGTQVHTLYNLDTLTARPNYEYWNLSLVFPPYPSSWIGVQNQTRKVKIQHSLHVLWTDELNLSVCMSLNHERVHSNLSSSSHRFRYHGLHWILCQAGERIPQWLFHSSDGWCLPDFWPYHCLSPEINLQLQIHIPINGILVYVLLKLGRCHPDQKLTFICWSILSSFETTLGVVPKDTAVEVVVGYVVVVGLWMHVKKKPEDAAPDAIRVITQISNSQSSLLS